MHYLLSGLAKCPTCGASMITQRIVRTNKKGEKYYYRYYACSQWAIKKAICHPNLINAELLENQVIKQISTFIQRPDILDVLQEQINNTYYNRHELDTKLKNINKEILKLSKQETEYYEYLVDDNKQLKKEKILNMIEALNTKIDSLQQEREITQAQIEDCDQNNSYAGGINSMLMHFSDEFHDSDSEIQKALLHSLINHNQSQR